MDLKFQVSTQIPVRIIVHKLGKKLLSELNSKSAFSILFTVSEEVVFAVVGVVNPSAGQVGQLLKLPTDFDESFWVGAMVD